jgi:hypothetical protein
VAAPSLRADLHATGGQLQLVIALYLIAFAALVVIGARMGDVLGRRRAFITGLATFAGASLAGGLAPSATVLILARTVQGAAAALMTPQVLALIQLHFTGEARARAIGAYSVILALGVAAGQVAGGLLVSADLLAGAWRAALLVNAPAGALLLLAAPRALPRVPRGPRRRLDLAGSCVLAVTMLALVVPLTLGRQAGWPLWVWPTLIACGATGAAFVAVERRVERSGAEPLFDLGVLALAGVAPAGLAVVVLMGCYAGFLLSLTLHLQNALRFSPLHAGAVFALYAAGFATASLLWPRLRPVARNRLPIAGPVLMGGALAGLGLVAGRGGWPMAAAAILLYAAGVGHACGYSPLANRVTGLVPIDRVTEVSGLLMLASLIGSVVGVTGVAGVYLSLARHGSAHALEVTTAVALAALLPAAVLAHRALATRAARGSGLECMTVTE